MFRSNWLDWLNKNSAPKLTAPFAGKGSTIFHISPKNYFPWFSSCYHFLAGVKHSWRRRGEKKTWKDQCVLTLSYDYLIKLRHITAHPAEGGEPVEITAGVDGRIFIFNQTEYAQLDQSTRLSYWNANCRPTTKSNQRAECLGPKIPTLARANPISKLWFDRLPSGSKN